MKKFKNKTHKLDDYKINTINQSAVPVACREAQLSPTLWFLETKIVKS